MPRINTGYWVRVVDGKVKDVWSSPPDDKTGWLEAVEVFPDIESGDREVVEGHIFDLTKNPVEIVYQKRPVGWDERRDSMISNFEFKVMALEREKEMNEKMEGGNAIPFDQAKLDAAIKERDEKVALLKAATSHEDLDKITL